MAAPTLIDTGSSTARTRLADVVEQMLTAHQTDPPPDDSPAGNRRGTIRKRECGIAGLAQR
jgi:hypothetical protein